MRVYNHQNNLGSEFTSKYKLHYLVYSESFPTMKEAIKREKQLKKWHREWKINLILSENPKMEAILV